MVFVPSQSSEVGCNSPLHDGRTTQLGAQRRPARRLHGARGVATASRPRLPLLWPLRRGCLRRRLVEERQRPCGFLALRPPTIIPPASTDLGFRFGHSLLGNADFVVVQFVFHFYGFDTYNVLLNPTNPLVQTVVTTMVQRGDYFFFVINADGSVTAFRSDLGHDDLAGLKTNLPRIQQAQTTETQYRHAVAQFEKHPDPPGALSPWVCHDKTAY